MGLFSKQGLPVNSTGYQNYMKDAATRLQEEEYARQRAEYSKANRATELGVEATTGQLGPNMGIPQQDGTGAFAYGLNPALKFQKMQNYERSMSGLPTLDDRANTSKDALDASMQDGIKAQELAQYKYDNIPQNPTSAMQNLVARGLQPGTPEYQQAMTDYMQKSGVNVTVEGDNPLGLGKAGNNAVDKSMIENVGAMGSLFSIGNSYADEYLGVEADAKGWVGETMDKFGLKNDIVDYSAQRTQFANKVEQQFNTYKKLITGAAASAQEMKMIRDSIMNMDQGPENFKASFKTFMDGKLRELEMDARAKGIPAIDVYKIFGFKVKKASNGKTYVNRYGGTKASDWEEVE